MVKSFLIPKLNEPKLAELINVQSAEYGIKVFVTNWKYQTASSLSNTVDSAMGQRDVIKGAMTDDETDDHQNKTDNPDLGNSTSNVTEKEKKFADAMHKVMLTNKWWYTTIPTSIVCSDFYTNMNFHTFYSFGFLRQWICLGIDDITIGKNGKIRFSPALYFYPMQPGTPSGLYKLCQYLGNKQKGEAEDNEVLDDLIEKAGPALKITCKIIEVGEKLLPDNLPPMVHAIKETLTDAKIPVLEMSPIILTDPRINREYPIIDRKTVIIKKPWDNTSLDANQTFNQTIAEKDTNYYENLFKKIPPDAWVIIGAVVAFLALKLLQRRAKRARQRKMLVCCKTKILIFTSSGDTYIYR